MHLVKARPTTTSKARPERYQKLRPPEREVLYLAFPYPSSSYARILFVFQESMD